MNKHAYLIIAHNNFEQLVFLSSLLDYKYHDIFILVDEKSDFSDEWIFKIKSKVKYSSIFFTKRLPIYWGGTSQISAELVLFNTAYNKGEYSYYHLLSGVDLPLASNKHIYDFFEANPNKVFLSLVNEQIAIKNQVQNRLKYYHLFSNVSSRTFNNRVLKKALSLYRRMEREVQSLLGIDLIKKHDLTVGYASNWVSLDNATVVMLLKNEAFVRQVFKYSVFSDEIFIPTMLSKLGLTDKIYSCERINDKPEDFQGNLRYINWWDGSPHTWRDSEQDFEQLRYAKKRGHLFSRKFDLVTYPRMALFIKELIEES
ncbi:hypothetical protein ACEE_10840 [Actinobacillus equuli subsp. equuli]|nr:hypothetical protein ACEE_10840 [Actinobacillus equuli subsp. equuli]